MDLIKSKKLSKSSTDVNQTSISANRSQCNRSQYIAAIKGILSDEYSTPSAESVRYFIRRLSATTLSKQTVDQLQPIVKEAFDMFVDDRVDDQLNLQKRADEENIGKLSHSISNCYGGGIRQDSFIRDEEFEKYFVVDIT
jgi:hypothetical protein